MSDNRIKSGIKTSLFGLHMIAKLASTHITGQSIFVVAPCKYGCRAELFFMHLLHRYPVPDFPQQQVGMP
jgi:hypothetical protein